VQRELDEAEKLNAVNGSIEGKLQLAELRADFLEVQGNREAAKALASETYPEAVAMGFGPIADHAKRLMEDDSLLLRWKQTYEALEAEDHDVQRANQSDDPLHRIADQVMLSVDSPPARLDVILDLLHSYRAISRDRLDWCRYLQLLENLPREGDPQTAYSELPTRICVCDKFHYETEHASADWSAVISDFRKAFCDPCLAPDPKNKPTDREDLRGVES
jgi:hypothetical protein